jgi:hypothetical protein
MKYLVKELEEELREGIRFRLKIRGKTLIIVIKLANNEDINKKLIIVN